MPKKKKAQQQAEATRVGLGPDFDNDAQGDLADALVDAGEDVVEVDVLVGDEGEDHSDAAMLEAINEELAGMTVPEIVKKARENHGLNLDPRATKPALAADLGVYFRRQRELESVGPDLDSGEVWDVSSRPRKYRRAGMAFGREPRAIDPAKLTDEQRDLIHDDPQLIVRKRQRGEGDGE